MRIILDRRVFALLLIAISLMFAPCKAIAASTPDATTPASPATTGTTSRQNLPEDQIPVFSQGTNQPSATTPPVPHTSAATIVLNMIGGLAVVLALAYLTMLGLKKYYAQGGFHLNGRSAPGGRTTRAMQVLEETSLGPGRTLYVVAAGHRCFLIGAAGPQLTMLGELTGDEEIEELLARNLADFPTAGPAFMNVLSRFLTNTPAQPGPAKPAADQQKSEGGAQ